MPRDGPNNDMEHKSLISDAFIQMSCSTVAADTGMMNSVLPLASSLRTAGIGVVVSGVLPVGASAATWGEADAITAFTARSLRDAAAGFAWQRVEETIREIKHTHSKPLVHVHGVWTPANVVACRACSQLGVPYVVSPHGMLLPAAMSRHAWRKHLALWATVKCNLEAAMAVHATSPGEAEAVKALAPRADIVQLPWGVQPAAPAPPRNGQRDRRIAVFLGRLLPHKGIYELVDAWNEVQPVGWSLQFIGSDPLRQHARLLERIRFQTQHDAITVLPALPHHEISALLHRVDLLILPSRSENFGLCVGEALAHGVPVIVSTETAWTSISTVGCGWIVDQSPRALADAIRAATTLPADALASMGGLGRDWVESRFSWPTIASRYAKELYRL
jgi:glycosyltransferase involved in cell wall biosynthesis